MSLYEGANCNPYLAKLASMDTKDQTSHLEAMNIEAGSIREGPIPKASLGSAHVTGHDTWEQVGLMMITGFNCGWILSFSAIILVPLGWAWGIPTMLVVALFVLYANWLLAGFHFIQGQRFIRYRDIMGFLFGRVMYYVTWIFQFLTLLVANMGFILLGGRALKELNSVFSDSTLRLQYFIIITGVAYFLFSFAVPHMSAMRVWLGASAFLTFGYTAILLVELVHDGKSNKQRDYEVSASKVDKLFNAFGALFAILVSNTSGMLPEIQSTLREPAVRNMRRALYAQYTGGLMVYYGITIVGYWAYGSGVSDYLPMALAGPKWVKVLLNSSVFLQNIISQHIFVQPVHEALDTKFLRLDKGVYSRENLKRRFLLRALFFTANTLVAAAMPFMGDFITLLGSFTLFPLTFIFPSMIFLKVKGKTARAEHKAWHWAIILVCSFLAVATTVSAVRSIFQHVTEYNLFADQ